MPFLDFRSTSETIPILGNSIRKLLWKGTQGYLTYLINQPINKVNVDEVQAVKDYIVFSGKN